MYFVNRESKSLVTHYVGGVSTEGAGRRRRNFFDGLFFFIGWNGPFMLPYFRNVLDRGFKTFTSSPYPVHSNGRTV